MSEGTACADRAQQQHRRVCHNSACIIIAYLVLHIYIFQLYKCPAQGVHILTLTLTACPPESLLSDLKSLPHLHSLDLRFNPLNITFYPLPDDPALTYKAPAAVTSTAAANIGTGPLATFASSTLATTYTATATLAHLHAHMEEDQDEVDVFASLRDYDLSRPFSLSAETRKVSTHTISTHRT